MKTIIYSELKEAWDRESVSYFTQISKIDKHDDTVYYYMDDLHLWIKRHISQWEGISGRRIHSPFICALINKKYKLAKLFAEYFDDDYFGELKIYNYLAYPWHQEQLDWIKANTTFFRRNKEFWIRVESLCKRFSKQ